MFFQEEAFSQFLMSNSKLIGQLLRESALFLLYMMVNTVCWQVDPTDEIAAVFTEAGFAVETRLLKRCKAIFSCWMPTGEKSSRGVSHCLNPRSWRLFCTRY